MKRRVKRVVTLSLLIAAVVGAGACLPPPGVACGDGWCSAGYRCAADESIPICIKGVCGDRVVESGEECDDGNGSNGDGCDSNCTLTACGNGVVTAGEMCDDGNANDYDGCNEKCAVTLLAYVKASNTGAEDNFGFSVALSEDGSILAVGAWLEDSAAIDIGGDQLDNSASNSGAVYVFTRCGATWNSQAYLKASNTGNGDVFGRSVALSADGSTLAVGARGEASAATGINGNQADNSVSYAGAVYVFTRSGTTWSQQAYLKASNTDKYDEFGDVVALSADGSTLAVGAFFEDSDATGIDGDSSNNSAEGAGAVYVFTRSGATWIQQAYVKASNTDASDFLGWSIALSADGSTLAVGAFWEDGISGDSLNNAGAVYVFTRSGTTWIQQAYVKASNADAIDVFGSSVALSGDGSTLAVGALGEGGLAGAVYVFTRNGTTWSEQAYLKASNTDTDDRFGFSVALSADGLTLAVGAHWEDSDATGIDLDQANNSAAKAGAVYVFTRSGTMWSQQAYVKASNTGRDDQFGTSVALSADGSTLAVGAPLEDSAATDIGGDQLDNSASNAGSVYVFKPRAWLP